MLRRPFLIFCDNIWVTKNEKSGYSVGTIKRIVKRKLRFKLINTESENL